jgi:hypothetical protein
MDNLSMGSLVVATPLLLAVAGFFRSMEQTKDGAFRDVTSRLGDKSSAVIRAAAAGQLPHFFRYKRYFLLRRPYAGQVLHLMLHALKKEDDLDVRQMLFNSLLAIQGKASLKDVAKSVGEDLGRGIDLVRARLDDLIMDGFNFDGIDMTEASMVRSSMQRARFVGAKLWKAKLCHANLLEADLTKTELWDANLEHADLRRAKLLTEEVDHMSIKGANLSGGEWSGRIDPRAMGAALW